MTDDRWIDVLADAASAARHLRNSVTLLELGGFEGDNIDAYRNRMALMHSMSSGYTALEASFERMMEIVDEDKPSGSDYHAALLRRLRLLLPQKRPAFFSEDSLFKAVDEVRRFRHVARKTYDDLDIERARPAVAAAALVAEEIEPAVMSFRAALAAFRT